MQDSKESLEMFLCLLIFTSALICGATGHGKYACHLCKLQNYSPRSINPSHKVTVNVMGHPFMTSAPRGGEGSGKADKVREVA